jgi:hypothetical protein
MLFYVVSGEMDAFVKAPSAREAATKSVRSFKGSLGVLVMVNEGHDNVEIDDNSLFFLTESILEQNSMRLVS